MNIKLPIRYKILFGFTLILLLSFITNLIGFKITEQFLRAQTERLLEEKAKTAADQIQNFIADIEVDHLGLATEFSKSPESEQVKHILSYTLDQNPYFEELTILSTTGREMVKGNRFGIITDDSLYFEIPTDSFNKATKGQNGISKVYFSEQDNIPHVDIFSPIISERGTVEGVIKGQLRLDRLWDLIAKSNIGTQGFTYVVDDEGRLIAHPDSELVKNAPILTERPIVTALLQNQSEHEYTFYQNENDIEVFAKGEMIPGLNWVVLTEQPVREAFRDLYLVQYLMLGTLLVSLLVLITLSIIISDNLTKPIKTLQLFANHIKSGTFETQTSIHSGDEIEDLGISLNEMSIQLKKNVEELGEKIHLLEMQKKNLDESGQLILSRDTELGEKMKLLDEQKKHIDEASAELLKREEDVKNINKELQEEKEIIAAERNKLAVVLSGIQEAVIAIDLNRLIIQFNAAAEKLTGYTADEVLYKPIDYIIQLYDSNESIPVSTYAPIQENEFEGVIYEKKEIELKGKLPKLIPVNLITGKIKESTPSKVGCILTFEDLTAEVVLEKMKIDFVSMAAHELRTPLTIIRGYTETLHEDTSTNLTEEQREFITRTLISVKALSDLIDNLLNVSHIEQGKFKVNLFPLQLENVISETINSFQSYIKSKEQTLESHIEEHLPLIMADKIRITQVLSNLIANAINYTPVKSTISVSAKAYHDEHKAPFNYVQISVKDTGQGIPKEALSHLFTKFFRVSGKLEQGSKGTGLGLFISKTIVTLHGGEIWAESEIGVGSTFTFILPVATIDQIHQEHSDSEPKKHGIILNMDR